MRRLIGLYSFAFGSDASAVYTFAPYTSLGEPPACNENPLDTLKDVLGLDSDYPSSRILSQFKNVGLKKLMQIVTGKNHKFSGDNFGRAHYGDSDMDKVPAKRRLLRSSQNSTSQNNVQEFLKEPEFENDVLRFLSGNEEEDDHELTKEFMNHILEDLLSKVTALISVNGGVLTGASSAGDAFDYVKDDLQVNKFLAGDMMSIVVDQVVDRARVSLGAVTNLTMSSAMINLGEALCNGLELAGEKHRMQAGKDACVISDVLREVLTCNALKSQNETIVCSDVTVEDASTDHCVRAGQDGQTTVIEVSINNWIDVKQGNMDRWLYQAGRYLYSFASTWKFCGVKASEISFLPGWDLKAMTRMNQKMIMADQDDATPISILLQNREKPCSFVAVSRGTLTGVDWLIDFATAQVDLEVKGKKLGRGHGGFANLAAPGAAFFAEYIEKLCPKGERPEVTFSGHSMGGSVSTLMALLSSEWLKDRNARIGLVAFAAPNNMDDEAAQLLLKRVYMRSWINAYDAVPKIPCANPSGMPRCLHTATAESDEPVVAVVGDQSLNGGVQTEAEAQSGATCERDYYSKNPNEIAISVSELSKFLPSVTENSFGNFSYALTGAGLDLENVITPGPLQLTTLHSDAYYLYLNTYFC